MALGDLKLRCYVCGKSIDYNGAFKLIAMSQDIASVFVLCDKCKERPKDCYSIWVQTSD